MFPAGRLIRTGLLTPMAVLLALAAFPPAAAAEMLFFRSGRTMVVRSHRMDGARMVLVLVGGGEISCDPSMVERFGPDEVPIREPGAEASVPPDPAAPFAAMIDTSADREGVDPRLVRAVIQIESAYQPKALSPKGAKGLMQLMPETARRYSVRNPYDPASNISAGIKHLRMLIERYGPEQLPLVLAAYNAGEAAVDRFGGIPPFPETQLYVRQVLGVFSPAVPR